jgi:hypothetical protein
MAKALLFPPDTKAPLPAGQYKVTANGYLVFIESMEAEELRLWTMALEAIGQEIASGALSAVRRS